MPSRWRFSVAKRPTNHRQSWTRQDVRELKQLSRQNTPTRVVGLKLGRTPAAVQSKASDIGLSLKRR